MNKQQIAQMSRPQVLDALRALHRQPQHSQQNVNVARRQVMQALARRLSALPADDDQAAVLADKRADALSLIAIMDASSHGPWVR